jgi:hypothetical protein
LPGGGGQPGCSTDELSGPSPTLTTVLLAVTDAVVSTLVVGAVGALGIGATFLAPSWSQKKIEERQNLRAFRTAKRLIEFELGKIALGCEDMLENPTLFAGDPFMVDRLPMADWTAQRDTLARLAPGYVWEAVTIAYLQTEKLLALAGLTDPSPTFEPGVEEFVTAVRDGARAGQKLVRDAEPESD